MLPNVLALESLASWRSASKNSSKDLAVIVSAEVVWTVWLLVSRRGCGAARLQCSEVARQRGRCVNHVMSRRGGRRTVRGGALRSMYQCLCLGAGGAPP